MSGEVFAEPPTVEAGEQQAVKEEAAEQPTEQQQQQEPSITSVWNGHRLHVYQWKPTGTPKGMLYLCHGVGEYMGRYEKLGEFLAENGILMFGHDHVGHGRSEGERVHVETFDTYVQDVIQHVKRMKQEHPDVPCLLMGHSMGGLLATDVAVRHQELFTGLILSGPSVEVDVGTFTTFLVRVIGFLLPRLGIIPINTDFISSIPEEVKMYAEDPLVYHGSLKAKWGAALSESMKAVRPRVGEIKLPLLIFQGTDDRLVPFSASQFVMDNVGAEDKTFKPFEGSRHEVLHDKDQEQARKVIKDWILDHLTAPPPPQPEQQPPPEQEPVEQEPAEQEPPKQEPAEQEPAEQEPAEQEPAEQEPAEQEPPVEQEPPEPQPLKDEGEGQEDGAKEEQGEQTGEAEGHQQDEHQD